METLDQEVLNMLADFDEEVMRDGMEETMFERAMRHWEIQVALDDLWGG